MNWDKNCQISTLSPLKEIEPGKNIIIKITDNTMADRYLPEDLVQIRLKKPEENSDCLIKTDNSIFFRKISNLNNKPEAFKTWPKEQIDEEIKDFEILGYATGILRS